MLISVVDPWFRRGGGDANPEGASLLVGIFHSCLSVHRGVFASGHGCGVVWQTPPWVDTPWADTPLADTPHQADTPPPADGQLAGGTHPTGMHSCFLPKTIQT